MPLFLGSLLGDLGSGSSRYWWDVLPVFFFGICLSVDGALLCSGAPSDVYWWGSKQHRKPGLWRLPSLFSTYSLGAKTYVSENSCHLFGPLPWWLIRAEVEGTEEAKPMCTQALGLPVLLPDPINHLPYPMGWEVVGSFYWCGHWNCRGGHFLRSHN